MAVSRQQLTSLSPEVGTTSIGLEERPDASLVWTPSAEPLDAKPLNEAKPSGHWRREMHPAEKEREMGNRVSRVPVVDVEGTPLMPCTPVKARILIKQGKARARWNKLGIFYVQLNYKLKPNNQTLALGIDPSSKFEGFSVVGKKDTVFNIMSETVGWVKGL